MQADTYFDLEGLESGRKKSRSSGKGWPGLLEDDLDATTSNDISENNRIQM